MLIPELLFVAALTKPTAWRPGCATQQIFLAFALGLMTYMTIRFAYTIQQVFSWFGREISMSWRSLVPGFVLAVVYLASSDSLHDQ